LLDKIEVDIRQLNELLASEATIMGDFCSKSSELTDDIIAIFGRHMLVVLDTGWKWIQRDGTLTLPRAVEVELPQQVS
jgi:hypothetical protein